MNISAPLNRLCAYSKLLEIGDSGGLKKKL